jgi:Domain of unknown function (DUF4136)
MRMRIATTFVVAAGLALAGSVAFAQAVTYDFDRTADFSKFKTYAWVQGTNLRDELNHERVVNAIDAQLVRKGFGKVDNANPDVLVAYHVTFERDVEFNGSSTGWGPYGIGASRRGTVRAQEVVVGTLTVEMMNAATRKVVWRGIASMDIDRKANPDKREKGINKAAEKIFKNYPRAS